MSYSINIKRSAQRSLARISQLNQNRIVEAIKALEIEPRPVGCKKLSGREAWRIRAGDYRVIYEIQESKRVVIVVVVGHRSQVYKTKS
ncbi:MAG TPA: type II toxin-antitoxin system mRNA interferase toxin, RelE/StbE family [Chromatiaceae bacterium]|nr:MAG: type II toxin-antitoxin system RelE/ParE family toxin [Thiohalocapsa sp. PB-PSB1]HBG96624.1 type II toxin-antitoxin system mRNA interferase toxin, RelE/StbE family [Chromatiaceae bacterium]HCS88963.1 type II toxin-antitoxin system mRNA interferase toxin, RelE/StbE family [Chromatiaceae bacterium]